MYKPGDIVATRSNVFWHGEDIGDRLAKVVSHKGHVMIELFDYDDNPVKCFTYELEDALLKPNDRDLEFDIEEMLKEYNP